MAEISFCALWLACACLCLRSVKVMPKKEGKPFTIAFVNFADGTLLGKCRDVLKILDETVPSWNAGVKISVAERSEEGGKVSVPCRLSHFLLTIPIKVLCVSILLSRLKCCVFRSCASFFCSR
jgi:hypothetical protein